MTHIAVQEADPLHAYQISKRANSRRVMTEAVRWSKRGARVNTISPGWERVTWTMVDR